MSRRSAAWLAVVALGLSACAHGHPETVSPLVPTPASALRLPPTEPVATGPFEPPAIQRARLSNGLSISYVRVPNADYVELMWVAPHHGRDQEARLLEEAIELQFAGAPFPLRVSADDERSLRVQLTCEPAELESALQLMAAVVTNPPSPETTRWLASELKVLQLRASLNLTHKALSRMRKHFALDRPPARAWSTEKPLDLYELAALHRELLASSDTTLIVSGRSSSRTQRITCSL